MDILFAGSPTASDLAVVESTFSTLNTLIPMLEFRSVEEQSDVSILIGFLTNERVPVEIDKSTWPSTRFLMIFAHEDFVLSLVGVAINADFPATVRRRSIVVGITLAMGVTGRSWRYPDSVFYEGDSSPTELADIDEAVIRLLYDPRIKPGMTMEDLERMGL